MATVDVVPPKPGKQHGGLRGFFVKDADHDETEDELKEVYKAKAVDINVTQCPGYLCHITATGRIPLPPKVLWEQLICHPDNAEVYRHMDRCVYRHLISDDGKGQRHFEVAHEASWHLLALSGSFQTFLDVHEDNVAMKMNFVLVPEKSGSIVARFNGFNKVEQDPQNPNGSIFTVDQDLQIKVWAPPPLDKVLKNISSRQVKRIFEDIFAEADKINVGKPSLCPYDEVKDKEIGSEEALVKQDAAK